jgi:hypothetical protein
MIYLKTLFTAKSELIYVLGQILELRSVVDRFIIVEPAFTHTGIPRKLIGIDFILASLGDLSKRVDYLPLINKESVTPAGGSEEKAHQNERITRGAFIDHINLKGSDIVISTDGDEVLYAEAVLKLINSTSFRLNPFAARTLRLHQFMYRDDLLAAGHKFYGPTLVKARRELLKGGYQNWRYLGNSVEDAAGCHFSWCMPISDLVTKVKTFAHGPSYYRSDEEALKRIEMDIQSRQYSFRESPIALKDVDSENFPYPKGYLEALKLLGN